MLISWFFSSATCHPVRIYTAFISLSLAIQRKAKDKNIKKKGRGLPPTL